MWIEREYKSNLERAVKERPCVLLTGVRQAGKSSLLKRLFPDAAYVSLDKVLLAEEAEVNPSDFLDRFTGRVIIDEIQYAPSLFRELKQRIDSDRDVSGRWILTGSQQFAMMKGVSESLAGRVRILNLGTLSAAELIQANLLNNKSDLLWKGGFPELWSRNLSVDDFFDDYIQTYLERDVKSILNVSNIRDFRRLISLLATRVAQLLNYSDLAKDLGVAVNTVKAWISVLEASGLILILPPYHSNLGKRITKSPKIYFCDNGLLASLLNISGIESLENSPFKGHLWENFVFSEFVKAGLRPGKNIFFFRDNNGVEIDFIIENQGTVSLIEAKYSQRPNSKKLNFRKVLPLIKGSVKSILACSVEEEHPVKLKDYILYNPLFGINVFS